MNVVVVFFCYLLERVALALRWVKEPEINVPPDVLVLILRQLARRGPGGCATATRVCKRAHADVVLRQIYEHQKALHTCRTIKGLFAKKCHRPEPKAVIIYFGHRLVSVWSHSYLSIEIDVDAAKICFSAPDEPTYQIAPKTDRVVIVNNHGWLKTSNKRIIEYFQPHFCWTVYVNMDP